MACTGVTLLAQLEREAMDLKTLTGRAGLIFTGVVAGIGYSTDRKTGHVYTVVTFRQIKPIKNLTDRFKRDPEETLVFRQYGGLREDGRFFLKIGLPEFELGNMYLVFFTGGPWRISPIVGWEQGYFRIVRSRTVGDAILLDHLGRVVVDISETIQSLPIEIEPEPANQKHLRPTKKEAAGARQDTVLRKSEPLPDKRDIYTEEGIERLLKEEAQQQPVKEADLVPHREIGALKSFPKPPVTLNSFIKAVEEIDKAHSHEFPDKYRKVNFDPQPLPAKLPDGHIKELK
jgi:hypothetical protein